MALWEDVHGAPLEERLKWGISRVLAPDIEAGLVRVKRANGRNYFLPADKPELDLPRFRSDYARVLEAVRRATERAESAVPVERVQDEVEEDSELHLNGTVAVATVISSLVREGEVLKLCPLERASGSRWYFTTPDGPARVHETSLLVLDLRYKMVLELWELSGGTPFTTRALRLFAKERCPGAFEDDPRWAWPNALQLLLRSGDLIRVEKGGGRSVRWALNRDWQGLSKSEQELRMKDPLLDGDPANVGLSGNEETVPRDSFPVTVASRNGQIRKLVTLTKRRLAASQPTEEGAALVQERPVSQEQVRTTAQEYAGTGQSVAPEDVVAALRFASKTESGTVNPAVVAVGSVGKRTYYDVGESPSGTAYVGYLRSLRDHGVQRIERVLEDLEEALSVSAAGHLPLGPSVTEARVSGFLKLVDRARVAFDQTHQGGMLLPDERVGLEHRILTLDRASERATRWCDGPISANSLPDLDRGPMDIAAAHAELAGFKAMSLENPRLLQGHLITVVSIRRSAPASDESTTGRLSCGRPVDIWYDRVSYALYGAARWGDARIASYAALAFQAAGDLRSAGPFIETLLSGTPATHAPSAAALGMFDDPISRQALVEYIERGLSEESTGESSVFTAAMEAAVYGLARLPFGGLAERLSTAEEAALEEVAERGADARLRSVAGRVLDAWREGWDSRRLLEL